MMQLSRLANCALLVLVAVLFDVGLAASFENGANKREQATRTFISKIKVLIKTSILNIITWFCFIQPNVSTWRRI